MSKLIIHNEIGDDELAMYLVSRVIDGGKVSKSAHGEQYCFLSVFQANDLKDNQIKVEVWCTLNKSGTHTFWVTECMQEESSD